ncbi:NAD(P)H-binding protein [Noviherbaspirillum sp.]|uniref:NAD(P)H-binding protein n=1 Tax=Noviherbaspirillum sp. TaxID=1926288 RepID=UPI002FE2B705
MHIAIAGATGNAGKRITAEALARGHHVTAISRSPDSTEDSERLHSVQADAHKPLAVALRDEIERPQHIRERFTVGY